MFARNIKYFKIVSGVKFVLEIRLGKIFNDLPVGCDIKILLGHT